MAYGAKKGKIGFGKAREMIKLQESGMEEEWPARQEKTLNKRQVRGLFRVGII